MKRYVHLVWTAYHTNEEGVHFGNVIYKRDEAILKGLKQESNVRAEDRQIFSQKTCKLSFSKLLSVKLISYLIEQKMIIVYLL